MRYYYDTMTEQIINDNDLLLEYIGNDGKAGNGQNVDFETYIKLCMVSENGTLIRLQGGIYK